MTALWIALAFLGGMAFTWKVATTMLYKALKRSLLFDRSIAKMNYETLLHMRHSVERELAKREAPRVDE